jgi:hypothetical protein
MLIFEKKIVCFQFLTKNIICFKDEEKNFFCFTSKPSYQIHNIPETVKKIFCRRAVKKKMFVFAKFPKK